VETTFDLARELFLSGVEHFEARRLEAAEACFERSLALLPVRVSTLVNLAATRIALGRPERALPLLEKALAAEPGGIDAWMHRATALRDLKRHDQALACHERVLALAPGDARAWLRHGQALQALDRHGEALASYDRALALDRGVAEAWTNRGHILKDLGRLDDAAAAFGHALDAGGDAALNGYYLAGVSGRDAPPAPPLAYVEGLFDDYAETFDAHTVGTLDYRAHRVLAEGVQRVTAARFRSALDLGCGTGLCGPLLAAVADTIDGVDVSARMLDGARALGVYDRLVHAELAAHLESTERRYDLVVGADVFIYVGALDAVFAGVARVLEPGGVFCFSVEPAADGCDFALQKTLRYAHSERYLRALAARAGFDAVHVERQPIRDHQRQPVDGLYLWLRKA